MWRFAFDLPKPRKLTEHQEKSWMRSYEALLQFVEREGHAKVPWGHHEGERALGRWVARQRSKWREGKLLDDHREMLEDLPGWTFGREGVAQMPREPEPRYGGHEWNFTVCGDGWRISHAVTAMIGLGALPRNMAVEIVTRMALGKEFDPEQHLREGSRMSWLVNRTLDEGLRVGKFDEPHPGFIRAVVRDGNGLLPEDWKMVVRVAKIENPIARDELIRLMLDKAVEIFGVDRRTLKQPGELEFLRDAIEELVEEKEIDIVDH